MTSGILHGDRNNTWVGARWWPTLLLSSIMNRAVLHRNFKAIAGTPELRRPIAIKQHPEVESEAKILVQGLLGGTIVTAVFILAVGLLHILRPDAVVGGRLFASNSKANLFGFSSKEDYLDAVSGKSSAYHADKLNLISQAINKTRTKANSTWLASKIVEKSHAHEYDPLFVASVIYSESTFNRDAVSPVGAVGLMQIMPSTGAYVAKSLGVRWRGTSGLRDADYNIDLGISYLKYLESMYDGDRRLALMAYNWGPANLSSALQHNRRIPGSVQNYADKVLNRHSYWEDELFSRVAALAPSNPNQLIEG